MIDPQLQNELNEHNLEIDDIRWYLSWRRAKELSSYQDRLPELCQLIWSGQLADSLYEMEERFLHELAEAVHSRTLDQAGLRSVLQEAKALQRRRRRPQ
jgi:hypothetical protein